MKVRELIMELQNVNPDAEVIVDQWVIEKKGRLVLNKSIVSGVVTFNGGQDEVVNIRTERIQQDIQLNLN